MQRLGKDAGAGLLFLACGLFFGGYAWISLPMGTAFRMGPGFFPVAVGGLLAAFGLAILVRGLRDATGGDTQPPVPWRAIALVTVALVFFGLAVRPLGMVPALFGASICAAYASRSMTLPRAAATAAGLTALCAMLFGYLLDLSVPLFGDWFR
jgi:hypothetical protein